MSAAVTRRRGSQKRTGKRKTTRRSGTGKARVVKGRLNLRVAGYQGVQKIPPSSVIPYIPLTKLRAAAKKVLSKTKKTTGKRRRRTGRRRGKRRT